MERLLQFLAERVVRHPWRTMFVYAVLVALAAVTTVRSWNLKTDQNDLVGADLEYNQRYLAFLEEFADLEFLYVAIEIGDDPQRAARVAAAVATEVEELTEHVEWVFHRIEPSEVGYGLLYQSPADLRALVESLTARRDELGRLVDLDRLDRLFALFAELLDVDRLAEAAGDGAEGAGATALEEHAGRMLRHTLEAMLAALEGRSPRGLVEQLEEGVDGPLRELGYLTTGRIDKATGGIDEKYVLVEILPQKDTGTVELIREPLLAVRGALDRVRERFPSVEMGLTGRPVLQADEMMTTDRDMRRATIAALIGVFVLFVVFFRRLVRPLLSVVCLGVAILLTFGVTMLTIGYLTLLSIVFAAMLVGLGIDFGIHFVARYQEELDRDGSVDGAIVRTLQTTGASIGTGAVTTAGAFFMTLFVDFQGLRELGFIAGAGVLICFLTMVTLLPVLILQADRIGILRHGALRIRRVRVPGLDRVPRWRWPILVVLGIVTAVGVTRIEGLPYSANLLDLQAQNLESVQWEMRLIEDTDFSTWYAAFICNDLETVRARVERLEKAKADGIVGAYESVLKYLPDEQDAKHAILTSAWTELGLEQLAPAAPSADVDPDALVDSVGALLDSLDAASSALVRRGDDESLAMAKEVFAMSDAANAIVEALDEGGEDAAARLAPFQAAWLGEAHGLLTGLCEALRPRRTEPRDLPEILRRRLVSKAEDRFIVYAYAQEDIWQEEPMERFITAMREIDPDVTGAPVQVYESAWRMRQGFLLAAAYSFGIVFLFLLLDLRSIRDSLLAMVPLAIGLLWLLELLPLIGLTFNLANFFALPILIGCGIDGGVHMLHRFRETNSARVVGRTTAAAVTLSFLTTMCGFGAMGTASHRGVASLGMMMVVGLLVVLLATVLLLPAVLRFFERREAPADER